MLKKILFAVLASFLFVSSASAALSVDLKYKTADELIAEFAAKNEVRGEHIDAYNVMLRLQENGDLFVSERIDYNFDNLERHGIFRDIPTTLEKNGKKVKLQFSDIEVTDENGDDYEFTTSRSSSNLQIKIGDPDRLITGKHTYIIDYKVTKPFVFLEKFDRLSWNAIGTQWTIPIDKATVEVKVPASFVSKIQNVSCYKGSYGSTLLCDNTESKYLYMATKLAASQGMTVDIDLQKGTVFPPTQEEIFLGQVKKWWTAIIPFFLFFFLLGRWYKTGRDPKGKGTIITQFDAPDNLSPAQVGTLLDEKAETKDIWAEIVHLAVLGYIRIIRNEKTGLFGKASYTLELLKSPDSLQYEFDKLLVNSLFTSIGQRAEVGGIWATVNLEDLKYKFAPKIQVIQDALYKDLSEKGYFSKDPQKTRWLYYGIAIFIAALSIAMIALSSESQNFVPFISIFLCGILMVIFASRMVQKTQKGVDAKEHILGLKSYLTVAEKDRINFHNAPEKNPATFEKFLPFAMVLGVETVWAKQFKDLEMQNPSWYSSSSGAHFSSLALVSSLNDFSHTAAGTLGATQSSSGGGGFSGGGGGGGGGGSW